MPLSLTAPPQFQETPPLVLEVKELEAVTLRCVARGSPQPYVTWKFRGRDLGKGQDRVQVSGSAGPGGPNGKDRSQAPGDGSEEGLPPASPRLRCCLPLLASPGSAGSEADQTGKGLFLKTPYLGAEWNTVDPAGGARQRRRLHLPSLQHRGQRYPRHPAAGARCSVVGGQGNRAT